MLYVFTALFMGLAAAQQAGTATPEVHPPLAWQTCTTSGGCQDNKGSVVLDSNWRWVHNVGGYTNCYKGTDWDASYCPDPVTCAKGCALDGADYVNTYGVKATGSDLSLGYVLQSGDVGSRVYLMSSDDTTYENFKLKNKEFTVTVDVSNLPCGLNGALYFVQMDPDGGTSRFPTNTAGAKYGTGYCDAQCPQDIKFINGEANLLNWNDTTAMGKYGTCCTEMDIWEANTISSAYTPHPCSVSEQTRCEDPTTCGAGDQRYDGVCDKDGCDLNTFRVGQKDFYGKGLQIDTSQPVTVITQFITTDGTDTGDLKEIKRIYVQNGKVINSPSFTVGGSQFDSVTDDFCTAQKSAFGDNPAFASKGGLKAMGDAMDKGMTLVMSIWDDSAAYMLWLDSAYPPTKDPSTPGVGRGTCPTSSGRPADVRAQYPNSSVKYSDIKFGDIGSTYQH